MSTNFLFKFPYLFPSPTIKAHSHVAHKTCGGSLDEAGLVRLDHPLQVQPEGVGQGGPQPHHLAPEVEPLQVRTHQLPFLSQLDPGGEGDLLEMVAFIIFFPFLLVFSLTFSN